MYYSWNDVSVARNLTEGDTNPISQDRSTNQEPATQPALALVSGDLIYVAIASSQNDRSPSVISKVDPVWDPGAGRNCLVKLSVVVNLDGKPEDIKVTQSGGKLADEKAVEALKQWRFRPGVRNCVPAKVRASVEMNFKS